MTKVDFYTGTTDKLRTACQLCHKAVQNGLHTVVSLPDDATLETLDRLMWQYPDTAFIPHCRDNSAQAAVTPVLLSCGADSFVHHEMLINLHNECVPFFSRFDRVIEIVSQDDADAKLGRERYAYYKDRGYELRHFDLSRAN